MSSFDSQESVKNNVREASDIVQVIGECVELRKAGTRFTGLCPFHAEKTPSFSVNPQGQFFHCFGCGESGDVFSFVMKYHHMGFPEALKTLARRYNIDLPERKMGEADRQRMRRREQLYEVNEAAALIFQQALEERADADMARKYLEERGVSAKFIAEYRIGFAPDPDKAGWDFLTRALQQNKMSTESMELAGVSVKKERGGHYDRFRSRIMFPISDMTGRVVAFGGRIVGEGKPKYMNSPETEVFDKSRLLFGLHQHRESLRQSRQALVVEGNFDLLLLAVHGITNVVAPLGTSLTQNHIRSLRGYCEEVVLLFDADAAGLKAAMRSVPFFLSEQVEGKVALLPDGQDPDSYVREAGPGGITRLVQYARPLSEFVYDTLANQHGLTLDGKNKILTELRPLVQQASDEGQRSLMIAHFSEKLGVPQGQFYQREQQVMHQSEPPVEQDYPSIFHLQKKEKQLVDFLILYPEFLPDLQDAGLREVVKNPVVMRIVESLQQLQQEPFGGNPEKLLDILVQKEDRRYVAGLLMAGDITGAEDDEDLAKSLLAELLAWISTFQARRDGASLLEQIQVAQRAGDHDLLMQLMQKKQESERKRTGF